jgi:hypothetical protein
VSRPDAGPRGIMSRSHAVCRGLSQPGSRRRRRCGSPSRRRGRCANHARHLGGPDPPRSVIRSTLDGVRGSGAGNTHRVDGHPECIATGIAEMRRRTAAASDAAGSPARGFARALAGEHAQSIPDRRAVDGAGVEASRIHPVRECGPSRVVRIGPGLAQIDGAASAAEIHRARPRRISWRRSLVQPIATWIAGCNRSQRIASGTSIRHVTWGST